MRPCLHSIIAGLANSRLNDLPRSRDFDSCYGLSSVIESVRAGMTPEEALASVTFRYRDADNRPPCGPEENPAHLPLLEEFQIPFIVDLHCHFFPPVVQKLIWRWFDRVGWDIAYRGSAAERAAELQRNGIRHYTTLLYAHKPGMAAGLNDWIAGNYQDWPGAIPFGTFFPEADASDYVRRGVEEQGLRGFKLHVEVSEFALDNPALTESFSYLAEQQLPIVIHSGTAPVSGPYSGVAHFRPLMERHPELSVIVAHMGAAEIDAYLDLMLEFPRLRMDTSMVFVDFLATGEYLNEGDILRRMEGLSDRIYFGTDFPSIPYNLSHPIQRLLQSNGLSASAKRRIFFENGMALFGLTEQVGG